MLEKGPVIHSVGIARQWLVKTVPKECMNSPFCVATRVNFQ